MNKILTLCVLCMVIISPAFADKPNVVLVMADDQGWGQTGYYKHPILKTPNLDRMAANGLRLNRFYAGAPVCSPTRASVLTGRCNDRTGVLSHGHPLRLQERTIAQALKKAGYATGHFGKWHLNGLRGPGVPVLKDDTHHPGAFGFDEWLTVTNFFDMNPLMGRKGKFEEFVGDSSEVIVAEALKFIKQQKEAGKPTFTVIWYGSPHSPWRASDEDCKPFAKLESKAQHHYGELVAMDRSIGTLRKGLKDMGLADNTLVWFNSDNGGLKGFGDHTVGGLRGFKGSIWEGGLRVPCVIEWPASIKPRITDYPSSTMDIMPTLVDLLGLPKESMLDVVDGISIKPLFDKEIGPRTKPIPFSFYTKAAIIDNDYKIVTQSVKKGKYELYDLKNDPKEEKNIFEDKPEIAKKLQAKLDKFTASIEKSKTGADYPEGKITTKEPVRMFWYQSPAYKPHLEEFSKRPEYKGLSNRKKKSKLKKKKK